MHELKHIAYRGFLRSCNYYCAYCPFCKKTPSSKELSKDAAALKQFVDKICVFSAKRLTIQILPYGEALLHAYYWTELARLSQLEQVQAVGCQTNLSFAVRKQLALFRQSGGDVRKLRLWCTFHPTMTTVEEFAAQCAVLQQEQIRFSAGVVGDPANLATIRQLQQVFPEDSYLWINRMEGLGRRYTAAEITAFTEIDPYFSLEITEPAANAALCSGGTTSLFVQGDGSCYNCNLNHRKLGNFYDDNWQGKAAQCSVRRCSCYLAYALRQDLAALTFFDQHPAFRIPVLQKGRQVSLKAIFFDLDGTLLNEQGQLRPRFIQSLPWLAQHYTLYLATQRPQQSALRIIGDARIYFTGGVFADGAYICPSWSEQPRLQPLPLDTKALTAIADFAQQQHLSMHVYREQEVLYKVTLQNRSRHTIAESVQADLQAFVGQVLVHREDTTIGIVSQFAGKWQGMLTLAQAAGFGPENIAYLGNAVCDVDIFRKVALSMAPADGALEALAAADYVLADW